MKLHEDIRKQLEPVLAGVARPARYLGGEHNMIKKDPEAQKIRVCLAFPDIYDIGQSYIGFYILYNILNKRPGTLCERTFSPWTDMEAVMREHDIPLWSLESFLPVSSFDVVGFTLQYELHYTTIINMLDLAGIPVRACDRETGDYPLVIGGGLCCVNPEPVAEFFDAFLLGDGEEAFPEILDVVEKCRESGMTRPETLRELTRIGGVYVPSLYTPVYTEDAVFAGMKAVDGAPLPVVSRYVKSLKPEYYPDHPLVPLCEIVHDRLAVELTRGCTRGCRFCNAGMIYRPKRERPVNEVLGQVVKGIESTGWEDISLVSLSTSDYPGLEELVGKIGDSLQGKMVSVSLASMRADNFTVKMAESVAGGRKSSLTFAIEAGTQRLRDVINKNLTENQFLETIETALKGGWNGFKLYFMVGLPTESDQDVIAIAELLNKVNSLLKRYGGKRVNVTISPFSPKPMTPFQWEAQDSVEKINEKLRLIRRNLNAKSVTLKTGDPVISMLECRIGRGGRETGRVLYDAWEKGSRLEAWSEHFNAGLWRDSFEKAGISLVDGFENLNPGSPLPWGHLSFGISESFLLAEHKRSLTSESTVDCDEKCHNCGDYTSFCAMMKKQSAQKAVKQEPGIVKKEVGESAFGRKRKTVEGRKEVLVPVDTRFRIKFGKNDAVRFTGHLDTVRLFDRAMRRAGIPLSYSQGFHPHPKISFSPPLPLGMKSTAEYADFSLSKPFPNIENVLKRELGPGFELIGIRSITEKVKALSSFISLSEYYVSCSVNGELKDTVKSIFEHESISVSRSTKKGPKAVDIRPGIIEINLNGTNTGFTMILGSTPGQSAKPSEVLGLIFDNVIPVSVIRTEQYAVINEKRVTPFEVLR